MSVRKLAASVVSEPDIIPLAGQHKSWCGVICDILHHVAILCMHHEYDWLSSFGFSGSSRDSAYAEYVAIVCL